MQKITYGIHKCEIGSIIIGHSDKGLCWLGWMTTGYKGNGLERMQAYFPKAQFTEDQDATKSLMDKIINAWKNDDLSDITLDIQGTDFHRSVWNALLKIPSGQTKTYQDIAVEIGNPKASRPVGTAVGTNPISLLIPCHRILKSDGSIGNYGWGVDVKENLLALEAQHISHRVKAA